MREIGVRDLKAALGETLQAVSRGESVRVTRHGRPVADLVPAGAAQGDPVRALVAAGRMAPPARPLPHRPPRLAKASRSASDLVLADRDAER